MPRAINNIQQLDTIAQVTVSTLNAFAERRSDTEKAFNFVENGSWEWNTTLTEELRARGLPTLKINIILPRILRIMGYEKQVRGKLVAIPTQDAGEVDANVVTRLFDWMAQQSAMEHQIAMMVGQALIGELGGWGEVYWCPKLERFDPQGPMGRVLFTAINSLCVLPDPQAELYTLACKGRFVEKIWWSSPEMILAQFDLTPEQEDEAVNVFGPLKENSLTQMVRGIQDWWRSIRGAEADIEAELVDTKENMFRIIQMQERVPKKRYIAWHKFDGRVQEVNAATMAQLEASGYWGGVVQPYDEIWQHTAIGNLMLLESRKREIQNGMFSIIPLGAYNFSGKNFGLVGQLEGVQEQYERTRSSILHILHKTATRAMFVTEGSMNPEETAKLEKDLAAAGLIVYVKPNHPDPRPMDNAHVPSGEAFMADAARRDADEISSMTPETRGGQASSTQPGIVFENKIQQSNTTLEPLFDNIPRTLKLAGKYALDIMRKKLSPGQVIPIVGKESKIEQITVDDSLQIGQYEIDITEGAGGKLQRERETEQKIQVFQMMTPDERPWPLLFKGINWHDKDEWVNHFQQRQGMLVPPEQRAALQASLAEAEQPMLPEGEEPLQLMAGDEQQVMME